MVSACARRAWRVSFFPSLLFLLSHLLLRRKEKREGERGKKKGGGESGEMRWPSRRLLDVRIAPHLVLRALFVIPSPEKKKKGGEKEGRMQGREDAPDGLPARLLSISLTILSSTREGGGKKGEGEER